MADESTAETGATQPRLQILGQYVRDMSFENVAALKQQNSSDQPEVQVQVNLDAQPRGQQNTYEVAIRLKIDSKTADSVVFVLEIDYAGLFHIENVPNDQMHPFLLVECPRMIFPYVRRVVSDITRDGGFPPLNLDNIDFIALYRQELARRAATENGAAPAS